jgi:RNA polymerase sigma-70 factor (ECF subfamily)
MSSQVMGVSDQELIRRYGSGQQAAMSVLMHRHKNRIFTTIYKLVRHQELAEDLFQDTFVKAMQTLQGGRYNEEGKFLPWILRIAHNLCIDHFRRNSKMPLVRGNEDWDPMEHMTDTEMHAEDKLMMRQSFSKVKLLVARLPEEQREVLIMRIYGDLSFKEIAEATGVSINTALGRMRYALNNLRKLIHQKGIIL